MVPNLSMGSRKDFQKSKGHDSQKELNSRKASVREDPSCFSAFLKRLGELVLIHGEMLQRKRDFNERRISILL